MSNIYPELGQRILEMAEGDDEFRVELTSAIYTGLLELKARYSEGTADRDEEKIQQIRHKIKPTVTMFEFDQLADSLQKGKEILDSEGFGDSFDSHFQLFLLLVDSALMEVGRLKN
ncbi:hypothetical protein J0A68_07650 [Algoriphagus sp. H41]|uniref:HPt domain-containing protein n=1 Tax=Algoriphagus oliviformis TaxID=2811231 RepID=A0ABS3C2J6_9BACT|nr:hypothetical protein [Algoriphagus oliviformis]MBN7810824.1 hypothetical protein [Algoriphagus oliviformis]